MIITSKENPTYKSVIKLLDKKYQQESQKFLIFGLDILNIAFSTGVVDSILTSDPEYTHKTIPVICFSQNLLNNFQIGTNFQIGAVCIMKSTFKEFSDRVLILDDVQDPRNLGVLLRSAVGFSFSVAASLSCCDIYNELVIRTSKGYSLLANYCSGSLEDIITNLKKKGYLILATNVTESSNPVDFFTNSKKVAIILGNEGHGINENLLKYSDKFIHIPTANVESLNVNASGAIIMYLYRGNNEIS